MPETAVSNARIDYKVFQGIIPEMGTGMAAVSHALRKSGIEPEIIELLKIRASQVNGCAFCVQFHLNLARKAGVAQTKLDLVAVWRDAGVFSEREMAALAWTEELTKVTPNGVGNEAYGAAERAFTKSELVFLTVAVASINTWNRIAMAFRFTPPIPQERAKG